MVEDEYIGAVIPMEILWVQLIVSDRFYGDETLLTSHKISSFYFLATSAKLMIFNVMKPNETDLIGGLVQ